MVMIGQWYKSQEPRAKIKNIKERRSYLDETNLQNSTVKVIVSMYLQLVGNLRLWSNIQTKVKYSVFEIGYVEARNEHKS